MTIFDVIRYPISEPYPTQEELEALPPAFLEIYKQKTGFLNVHTPKSIHQAFKQFHKEEAIEDIKLLRKMIQEWDE